MRKTLILLALTAVPLCAAAQGLILTSDGQLRDIATAPDKKIDNTQGLEKSFMSLNDAISSAKQTHKSTITIAFDEFFRQYRADTDTERRLTPDMDEYVELIGKVSDRTSKDGIGLELSLNSPLELGQAYRNATGHTGCWIAYKTGLRDGRTGRFSVDIWQQLSWCNNKGRTPVKLKDVRAYAFRSTPVTTRAKAVNPADIVRLPNIKWEETEQETMIDGIVPQRRLRVYNAGDDSSLPESGNVLVLLELETQEMDYFADDALPFLKSLFDKYHKRGVRLNALYSDEMHIQQDWAYYSHHEEGQFNCRYFTPALARRFKAVYGQELDERYLLYFDNSAPVYMPTAVSVVNGEYVLGQTPQDVYRTWLLRDRYYRLLNNSVVDLFKASKTYAENLFGRKFTTSAHASWAQSPTCDLWFDETPTSETGSSKAYEYTPNFLWSNTVHQASAACYDYFKWGEYLEPTGNDFCEGGWGDRCYYGAAMAASIAAVNRVPNAYAAAWGLPKECLDRRMAINYAFGCKPPEHYKWLTGDVVRDVDVLVLYPTNMVAVDPRFGSWMTQYGYANYLTSDKFLAMAALTGDGHVKVEAKRYGTIVVPYEPLPAAGLIERLAEFAKSGGRVIWMSQPPLLDTAGHDVAAKFRDLFGVDVAYSCCRGVGVAGQVVNFKGTFARISPQLILTDLMPDLTYAVTPHSATETVATLGTHTVGTLRHTGKGLACYLGFRPRDDQSASLGYETRTLFEILDYCGSYPPTGKLAAENDNPEWYSRHNPQLATRFPNGATFVVCHYRHHPEKWTGGFSRDQKADDEALRHNPLPSDTLTLVDAAVNGHKITYNGRLTLGFNTASDGLLTAFMGQRCNELTLDGTTYRFAQWPFALLTFAATDGDKASHYRVSALGTDEITLPVRPSYRSVKVRCGNLSVPAKVNGGTLTITLGKDFQDKDLEVTLK